MINDALERENGELRAIVDVMRGALAGSAAEQIEIKPWMIGLARQERALVGALIAASPRAITFESLLAILPCRDHVDDREVRIVQVIASRARKRVGSSAIQTLNGVGYFMPLAERDRLLTRG